MPAQKKDPTVRARRNKTPGAAVLRSTDVDRPELPEREDRDGNPVAWSPMTLAWWDDLWSSPMAGEYHSSDRHSLFILAALVDQFWAAPSKELAGEIRLQRQAFGLTPYDRRRLEWTIETAAEAKDRGEKRRTQGQQATAKASPDPRLGLHAVS